MRCFLQPLELDQKTVVLGTSEEHRRAEFGMWVFLASEVLLFGSLFFGYTVTRWRFPAAFDTFAEKMELQIGTINTAILLTSSFVVVLAVTAASKQKRRELRLALAATAVLGLTFEGLKFYEYFEHFRDHLLPHSVGRDGIGSPLNLFVWFYYVATGLHALHVAIGIGLFSVLWRRYRRPLGNPEQVLTTVTVAALYWHFVDLVWIFLYPLLYFGGHPG